MSQIPDPAERMRMDHYFNDAGLMVFTEQFHLKRGNCCGNGCKHCPFTPRAIKGNRTVDPQWTAQAKG